MAKWTGIFDDDHLADLVSAALHEEATALWAVGILRGVTRHIADVDKANAFSESDLTGVLERCDWGRRQMRQFIVGKKLGEVKRHVEPQIRFDPARQCGQFVVTVVERWDEQVDDLYPLSEREERHQSVEHGIELTDDDLVVVGVRKGLQIDFDGIHATVDGR